MAPSNQGKDKTPNKNEPKKKEKDLKITSVPGDDDPGPKRPPGT